MALSRYVLTATVTVAAGTAATVVAGEPGTGGAAGFGGAGNLRLFTDGTDNVGHAALAN